MTTAGISPEKDEHQLTGAVEEVVGHYTQFNCSLSSDTAQRGGDGRGGLLRVGS